MNAQEVAERLGIDLYGIPSEPWDARELGIIAAALEAYAKEKVEEALQKRCLAEEAKSSQREADARIAESMFDSATWQGGYRDGGELIARRIRESGDRKSALADDPK